MKPILTVLSMLFLMSVAGHAQTAPGDAAKSTLESLINSGVNSVGDLNLNRLLNEINQITWIPSPKISQPQAYHPRLLFAYDPTTKTLTQISNYYTDDDIERSSGHYDSIKKNVTLLDKLPKASVRLRPALELHEALGALGYNDKNYAQSTALIIIKDTTDSQQRQDLLKNYGQSLFVANNLIAGGSSVGGGGDIVAIQIKDAVLKHILKSKTKLTADFLTSYPEIAFEPSYDANLQFSGIEYKIRSTSGIKSQGDIDGVLRSDLFEELITIHCPAKDWLESAWNRRQITRRISDLILSISPSPKLIPSKVMVPPECPASTGMSFVNNEIKGMITMQAFRAMYFGKCQGSLDFEDMSTKFPSNGKW